MKAALREDLMRLLIKDGVAPSSAQALLNQLADPVGLRDTFASAAMQGLLSAGRDPQFDIIDMGSLARTSYCIAEAMLEARNPS